MLLQLTASAYFDFLQQYASLARDPVGYGVGVPRGDGRPVLMIPGFTAGDWSLGTMARWLGRIGGKFRLPLLLDKRSGQSNGKVTGGGVT